MSSPFIAVECVPCTRQGVWWAGAEFVLHLAEDGETTWACQLPPRDEDRLTGRERASLDRAIVGVVLDRQGSAVAA